MLFPLNLRFSGSPIKMSTREHLSNRAKLLLGGIECDLIPCVWCWRDWWGLSCWRPVPASGISPLSRGMGSALLASGQSFASNFPQGVRGRRWSAGVRHAAFGPAISTLKMGGKLATVLAFSIVAGWNASWMCLPIWTSRFTSIAMIVWRRLQSSARKPGPDAARASEVAVEAVRRSEGFWFSCLLRVH